MSLVNKQTTDDAIDRSQEISAARAKLLRLVQDQGVMPIQNTEKLAGEFWSAADETEEDFDTWLRRLRSDGNGVRLQQ